MTKIEKNVLSRIEKNRGILFFMIISLIGFFARYVGFEFISGDMKYCLMVWFDKIKDGGSLASLKSQVGQLQHSLSNPHCSYDLLKGPIPYISTSFSR